MSAHTNETGQRVHDISKLIDVFQAQEGEVQQIIGKTGNGKTYEATRRAYEYLRQGYVVYTTWQLILPDTFDERESAPHLFFRLLFGKKRFYRFDFKKNWHYIDIDRDDLIEYVANLSDCIVMMDEGQDVFDARGGMDKAARKTITRTRHMRKTLIIISQRAQAVDVTARANVTYFFKCVKTVAWFWPFKPYFKIYRTEEMDDQNYPIWEYMLPGGKMWKAEIWKSHFADQNIYDLYNSWYLSEGKAKSQEVYFEAYELTSWQKLTALIAAMGKKKSRPNEPVAEPREVSEKLKKLSTALPRHNRRTVKLAIQYDYEEKPKISESQEEAYSPQGSSDPTRGNNVLNLRTQETPEIAYGTPPTRTVKRARAKKHEPQTTEAGSEAPRKTVRVKAQSAPSSA